ncbi:MAG: ssDNA-binding domain-containing protein [Actinomycetia bacterium]|nr:ssDNA-binding domain-containing protein [Actinomycetes bacterium]
MATVTTQTSTTRDQTKERLMRAVAALSSDEGFRRWLRLRTTTGIGRYSLYNQLLIAYQKEDATQVAGYRAWQREGRQVKKGSKAIWVFAPIKKSWNEIDEEGNLRTHLQVNGFCCVPVFDISQTTGPKLPTYQISPKGNTMGSWLTRLQGYAATQGIMVEVKDTGSAEGFYSPADNLICLSERLDTDGMAHCLVHELIHATGIGYKDFTREAAEIITETAATIICAELGLSTIEESTFYVMAWAEGDIDKVLEHMRAADEIARRVEAGLGLNGARTSTPRPLA